jgi:hypothetical protein
MRKFINYMGNGLTAFRGHDQFLVTVAYYENDDGSIYLRPESGHNMAPLAGAITISLEQFNRERPADSVESSRWALRLCGYHFGTAQDWADLAATEVH